jgi:O-antigen ligase
VSQATYAVDVDLEPVRVGARTYATRRNLTRIDVANVIIFLLALLYLLPAHLIIPNLTYAGRPALVVALALWCWWLLSHLSPRLVMTGPQPMRWAVGVYILALAASYLAGVQRGLTTLEANGQDFAVISAFEFFGVTLMAADGIPNWQRLHDILKILVAFAGFMAVIGVIQAFSNFDPTQYMQIPGLQLKGTIVGFEDRGSAGLHRVAGTATHYIEFATVLGIALPFAIHYARFSATKNSRKIFGALTLLIAVTIPLAISRTGVLALALGLIVMFPVWKWRFRYNVLCVLLANVIVLMVIRPGLLGTLRSYVFSDSSNDPSIEGRTEDYAFVEHWFSQRPLLGRGPGTLIPVLYRILDNQWLGQLVTFGLFGTLALLALHITAITQANLAKRRSTSEADKHLCQALIAAQVICIAVEATFDSMSFTTFSTTFALMLGLSGAVWRITHPARMVRTSTVRRL